ncbi:MAG TPA: branched-chain amino acid ABC transporter permease [Dongiaceae bacterium]|nr:branched-chain amino acid ABC transporter permease [Dongiaceae bacterium]
MDAGTLLYLISLATMIGLYAILALGLNLQWGFAGLFNAGIAGFFAVGAYTTSILTTPPSADHLGGYSLPIPLGILSGVLLSALLGYAVARICLRLKSDYLAIATIGIAEMLRMMLRNEVWMTNGSRGIADIPRPFEGLAQPWGELSFLALVAAVVILLYAAIERAWRSPWGRTLRAIRENDEAAEAAGKDVIACRAQVFTLGSAVMGLAGGLMAHYFKFIGPDATEPILTTFIAWVMLIAGGSGNNRGAVLGAAVIWTIWSTTELLTQRLPADWQTRSSYIRVFLIGLLLQIVLQRFSRGLLPERPPRPKTWESPSKEP